MSYPSSNLSIAETTCGFFHDIGAKDVRIADGQSGVMCFSSQNVAPLAAIADADTVSALRAIIEVPAPEEAYGLVEVTRFEGEAAISMYGLSRFSRTEHGKAEWQGAVSRHIAKVYPRGEEVESARQLSWCASFMSTGRKLGEMIVGYSGIDHVGLLVLPATSDPTRHERPITYFEPNIWCPTAHELFTLAKPELLERHNAQ